MKQQLLLKEKKSSLEFGGSLLKGHRKGKRPVVLSKPLHLVMRSEVATGKLSLTRFKPFIHARLQSYALKYHIKVYKLAINRNHLHLCIQGQDKEEIATFLKVLAGILAKKILFHSKVKQTQFWTERVYSRVVQWGRDFRGVLSYIEQNILEASGVITYKPRKIVKKNGGAANRMSPNTLRQPNFEGTYVR